MLSGMAAGYAQCQGRDAQGLNTQALCGDANGQGLIVGPFNLRPGLLHTSQGIGCNSDADSLLSVMRFECVQRDPCDGLLAEANPVACANGQIEA